LNVGSGVRGDAAKVLEPSSLVKEIKDDLEKSLRAYAKT